MLTETNIIDKIEILQNGVIQIRSANIIFRDDVEISKAYHRECFTPGTDITGKDQKIIDIASTVWTPEVIANYQQTVSQATLPV